MAGNLSELVKRFREGRAPTKRPSLMGLGVFPPQSKGFGRGASGSTGAVPFQPRNPYAGEEKELEIMQSPEFQEFMSRFAAHTPIYDFLRSRLP